MTRSRIVHMMVVAIALAAVASLAVVGGCKKSGEVVTPPVISGEATSTGEPEGTVATGTATAEGAATAGDDGSGGTAVTPNAPKTLAIRLYWVEAGENALGVERTIPYTKAVATAALNALFAGPTAQEKTTWPAISSAIPAGTKLLGVSVANGIAKVDLSKEFESGGGTFGVTARLAQVVYTLDQFPTVDAVEFYIEGKKVEVFSSEGLILDGPQRLDDYQRLLPIDA